MPLTFQENMRKWSVSIDLVVGSVISRRGFLLRIGGGEMSRKALIARFPVMDISQLVVAVALFVELLSGIWGRAVLRLKRVGWMAGNMTF